MDPPSATVPPAAPPNPTASLKDDGSVTLSWDAPDDDSITGYQILRRRPTQGEDTLEVYVEDTGSTDTTYSGGNEDGKFDMVSGSGEIPVAGSLYYRTVSYYTLTIEADDDTATAT